MSDKAKNIQSVNSTTELYLEYSRSEFDNLWEDAILRVLSESNWNLTNDVSTRKTSFIWLFLYDFLHATGKSIKNHDLARAMLLKVSKEVSVDESKLFLILKGMNKQSPDIVFQHIYKIVDENFIQNVDNNSDVKAGFIFLQHKVYDTGYLNQVMTTRAP